MSKNYRPKAAIFSQSERKTRRRVRRREKCKWPNLEEELYDWIVDMRQQGRCVSGKMVRDRALQLVGNLEFRASNGWLNNFLARRHLVRRRVTTSGRDLPTNAPNLARTFLSHAATKFCRPNFQKSSLLNMDETSFYLDEPSKLL